MKIRQRSKMAVARGILAVAAAAVMSASASAQPLSSPSGTIAGSQPIVATPEAIDLARRIVKLDGYGDRLARVCTAFGDLLADKLASDSDTSNSITPTQVRQIIDGVLGPIVLEAVEARSRTLATLYGVDDLRALLAFRTSATAIAFREKQPLLQRALGELIFKTGTGSADGAMPSVPDNAYSAASPETRQLVQRIIRNEDIEAQAARAWDMLARTFRLAAAQAVMVAPSESSHDDAAARALYAKQYVETEERFLSANFSDPQLAEEAAYLERHEGKRIRDAWEKNSTNMRQLSERLVAAFPEIHRRLCRATVCTTKQTADFDLLESFIPSLLSQLQSPDHR
jgi:hypothetical protein